MESGIFVCLGLMFRPRLGEERKAFEKTIATLRMLHTKWWGITVDDLKQRWGKYTGKWVVFECYHGCSCIRKDPKLALKEARKLGFHEPHLYLYDVSSDTVYLVTGAKFERAPTTLVASQRVETPMRVS
jgi:hypothetical protein